MEVIAIYTNGFNKLHNNVVASAMRALEQIAPGQVKAFKEASEKSDITKAMNVFKDFQTGPQFSEWRDICVALIDVRLQMHRVKTGLFLLNMPPLQPITLGEWTLYQHDVWWIWMQGLIDRYEKLVKRIIRSYRKSSDSQLQDLESEIMLVVRELRSKLRDARGSIAHGGGAVEAFASKQGIERYVLTGGNIDMASIFAPMASYQQRWHQFLTIVSNRIIDTIDKLSERLNNEVEWDSIR